MKIRTYIFALLAAGALLLPGCKKDEDDKPSLSGDVRFDPLPAYVLRGDSFHIVATGAYRGSDKADSLVGYYMYDSMTGAKDTLRREGETGPAEGDFVVSKDSLGKFSLTVYAFAKGYYGASYESSYTVVNPSLDTLKGSLTGHQLGYEATETVTDPRDGQTYYVSGTLSGDWMLQNLAWEGAGYPFANSPAMSYIAGRFYNWEEAKTACPAGWRLPNDGDFAALFSEVANGEAFRGKAGILKANVYFNGKRMWTYNTGISFTNDFYFTAMPWGYMVYSGGVRNYKASSETAAFWTSTIEDSETAYVRYLSASSNDVMTQAMDKKSFYASVRCIKE